MIKILLKEKSALPVKPGLARRPAKPGLNSGMLSNHYNFSGDESQALSTFPHTSPQINSYLLHAGGVRSDVHSEVFKDRHEEDMNKLDPALQRHKTPADMVVHTGTFFNPTSHHDKVSPVIPVHLPGYTSASMKHSVAADHARELTDGYKHVVSIHVPKGSAGAYIDHHSMNKGEHEFVMNRNARVHIHARPHTDPASKTVRWNARLVHDGVNKTRHLREDMEPTTKPKTMYNLSHMGLMSRDKQPLDPSYRPSFLGFVDKIKEYEKRLRKSALLARQKELGIEPKEPIKEDFTNIDHMHHILGQKYNYTQEEAKVLRDFTDKSVEVNAHHLRAGNVKDHTGHPNYVEDPNEIIKHEKNSDEIDQVLRKHKTDTDMIVHTGIGDSPIEHHDGVSRHIKLHLPAYTSTSLKRKAAHAYTVNSTDKGGYSHIVSIRVPEGSHGAYAAHHSWHPHENEFVLHRNSKVFLHPTPDVHFGKKVIHWFGRLVHDGVRHTKYAKEGS